MKKKLEEYATNKVKVFVLRTGVSCNNYCIHCFNGEKRKNKIGGDLALDELKSIVDKVDLDLTIMISGGEATIRPDLPELLQYIREKGHDSIVQSNGFKFGDMEYAKKLAPYFDLLNVPIHSCDKKIFDAVTQIPGSFEQTIQGIKNLKNLGIYISTQTVINQLNYRTLPATFDFIQNLLPGTRMQLTMCHPTESAYSTKVQPRYKDTRQYIQPIMKKYSYLMHTHYIPKCYLYPYHTLPYILDETDDGSFSKPGWDYGDGEWNFFDYGEFKDYMRVKATSCKECIFNNECVGVLRRYLELYTEFDKNFSLTEDLIPIKTGYSKQSIPREEIKSIPNLDRETFEPQKEKAKKNLWDPPRGHIDMGGPITMGSGSLGKGLPNYKDMTESFVYKNNKDGLEEIKKIWQEYVEKKTTKDYLTLYIHVPYCTQKCLYCEYFSKVTSTGIPEKCLDYLEEQFKDASPYFKTEKLKAINFGGGTPNLLSAKQLDRVLKMIQQYWNVEIDPNNEMGFEFNPYHLTEEHLQVLENSYINRISMGVQSFDETVITNERRLYSSPEKISQIYNRVKKFAKYVNVDLLAGLIGQTPEILLDDVQTLLDIGVEAITVYEVNKMPLHHENKEVQHEYVEMLLMKLGERFENYPGYRYVGTTAELGFTHCNRLYKKGQYGFENFYCPSPQGYNNLIAFSIDDDDIKIYPYSHFICIDKSYQRLDNDKIYFYPVKKRQDRPFWLVAEEKRI
jgi:MoaA/NifB/PqqE/SkfB family radical SAM enzyme